MTPTLVFVYNAADGIFAAIGDAVHKAVSPDTYPCSLCAITYGAVSMRPEWRAYLRTLPYPARFLHRGEFARAYPDVAVPLPVILLDPGDGQLKTILGAENLDRIGSLDELISSLRVALAPFG